MKTLEEKKAEVEGLLQLMRRYGTLGIAGVKGIPAKQLQHMRKELGCKIMVVKNSLLRRALEIVAKEKPVVKELKKLVSEQSALVASELNAFKLFKSIEDARTRKPAKGGEIAPENVTVSAGVTPFKPGPVVGELQRAGLSASIEEGGVVIGEDAVVARASEPISKEVAEVLSKLDILPLEIGLNLRGVCESEIFFTPEVLRIDKKEVKRRIMLAHRQVFALSKRAGYLTSATVVPLLREGSEKAFRLSFNLNIPTPQVIERLLRKAHLSAQNVKAMGVES